MISFGKMPNEYFNCSSNFFDLNEQIILEEINNTLEEKMEQTEILNMDIDLYNQTNNIEMDELKQGIQNYDNEQSYNEIKIKKACSEIFKTDNKFSPESTAQEITYKFKKVEKDEIEIISSESLFSSHNNTDNASSNKENEQMNEKSANENNKVLSKIAVQKKQKNIFNVKKIKKIKKKKKIIKPKLIVKKTYNYGRKKKAENITGKHNKLSSDNIIIKIKGYFFQYIRDITKKNAISGRNDLKKLPYKFIVDLNKKKNEQMFNMKIKDILSNFPISSKNKNSDRFENKKIIDRIYKRKKEIKVIKILELTFKELFLIFINKLNYEKYKEEIKNISEKIEGLDLLCDNNRYKDITYLLNYIKEKNKNDMNEEEVEEYTNKVKNLCCSYEKWFNEKIARKPKKIN